MEKMFYSISEVADILGESTSLVRFWSNTFEKFIKPDRNAHGTRKFRPEDVETLKQIHHLVKVEGLSLEGAARALRGDRKKVSADVKVLESLREIRSQLVEIKNMI